MIPVLNATGSVPSFNGEAGLTIEETAKTLGTPVRIEGYKPPSDPRLASFSVSPDPGVIEVNIHPSKNWDQLVSKTRAIYEEARNIGLGTEKFLQAGRHSGTGGGNHIVVGTESPLDSPFLRRPEVLASLITYFNNHPSLSYIFSGLFIGPTSQAPHRASTRPDTTLSTNSRPPLRHYPRATPPRAMPPGLWTGS